MIRDVERYHGAALARLVRAENAGPLNLRAHPNCRSAYVVADERVLYVKYSTSRLSPWSFNFTVEHRRTIEVLRREFADTFIALVCGFDGIICLNELEYSKLVCSDAQGVEWIRGSRGARQKYSVTGSRSRRPIRIGDSEYPIKVLSAPDEGERARADALADDDPD